MLAELLNHLCRSSMEACVSMSSSFSGQLVPDLNLTLSVSSTQDKIEIKHKPSFESFLKQTPLNKFSLPLFFPTKEVLSIYPGFITSYEDRESAFDETYYDLCKALTRFLLRRKRYDEIVDWTTPLEQLIPGKLIKEFNRFYLQVSPEEKREISLVAEGIRKIAMLNYLILNGSLTQGTTLFWDEPEANLNAKLQVKLVDTLVQLANAGVQIVIAVHDLFLMKELALRVDAGVIKKAHFIELLEKDGEIQVIQGENLDDLSTIVALDSSLDQYDRVQEVLLQDY